jgi:hypothetical protein
MGDGRRGEGEERWGDRVRRDRLRDTGHGAMVREKGYSEGEEMGDGGRGRRGEGGEGGDRGR